MSEPVDPRSHRLGQQFAYAKVLAELDQLVRLIRSECTDLELPTRLPPQREDGEQR